MQIYFYMRTYLHTHNVDVWLIDWVIVPCAYNYHDHSRRRFDFKYLKFQI